MLLRTIAILFACSLFSKCYSTQFTSDTCCQDSDCAGERTCLFLELFEDGGFDVGPCAPGKPNCMCAIGEFGILRCDVDADCPEGDLCQFVPDVGRLCQSRCLREIFDGSLTEEDKAVCNSQPEFPNPCPANARPSPTPRPSREPRPSKTPVPGPQVIETPSDFDEVEGTPLDLDALEETPFDLDEIEGTPFDLDEIEGTPFDLDEVEGTPFDLDEVEGTPLEDMK